MDKFSDKYINNFNILNNAIIGFEWEFYTDKPYHKLMEYLNRELDPVKTYGYRVYHSSGEVTADRWKFESDLSLGPEGVELISGPLPYVNSKIYLLKVLKIMQGPDFHTDEKCSLHINISFDKDKSEKVLDNLNKLKLLLNVDEEFVYKYFPERENNFYAKSVKKIIPFKNFDFSSDAAEILTSSLELPDTKYYGINFINVYDGRLEFRYVGDKNYEDKPSEILELLDYFILLTWNCIDEELDEDDMEELLSYLSENINQFKNFVKYDNFISEFPSIKLQVDKNNDSIIVKTYYEQFYEQLYDVITNIYNLNDCIINYDTDEQKIEIVDGTFKTIFDIKNINIIDCVVDGGSFSNCNIINSEIKSAHISNSKIYSTDVFNSKIESSTIDESSVINDSYLFNCLLNGSMKGGIFRSGKLGEYAELDNEVRIVTTSNNYFNQKFDNDITKTNKTKGVSFKKNKKF